MEDLRFNKPIEEPIEPEKLEEPNKVEEKNKTNPVNPKIWQKIKKQNVFYAIILLIVVVSVGAAVNFYFKAKKLESGSPTAVAGEVQKIVAEVGKLIVLPESEEPTVATISDVEKLRGQPFFANAQNGDKVLIYTKAQKAILYDPINNIIVEVAPLNSGTSGNTGNSTP